MTRRAKSKNLDDAKLRLRASLQALEQAAGQQHAHIAELERDLLEAKARAHKFEDELGQTKTAHSREKQGRIDAQSQISQVEKRLDDMADEILSILQRSNS